MIEDYRFDRAVLALDAAMAQTTITSAGYEDGLVAGMMDFSTAGFHLRHIARSIGPPLVLTSMSSVVVIDCLCLRRWTILSINVRQSDEWQAEPEGEDESSWTVGPVYVWLQNSFLAQCAY